MDARIRCATPALMPMANNTVSPVAKDCTQTMVNAQALVLWAPYHTPPQISASLAHPLAAAASAYIQPNAFRAAIPLWL